MRYSKQRDEILQILRSTTIHPDAEWIYQQVKQKIPSISRGTVYRNLKELYCNGDILMFNTGEVMHFDGDISDHAHFACKGCGKIIDLRMTSNCLPLLRQLGFSVECEKLIFYGDCPSCAKKAKLKQREAIN